MLRKLRIWLYKYTVCTKKAIDEQQIATYNCAIKCAEKLRFLVIMLSWKGEQKFNPAGGSLPRDASFMREML